MTGINGQSFISNVVSVPIAYETPLNRSSWIYSFPFGNKSMMYGGSIEDVETSLRDLGSQYGYDMLSSIYEELVNTMSSLSGRKTVKMTPYDTTNPVPGFNIKLSDNTQNKIKDLLDKFKEAEEQLREQMEKLVKANKLYRASYGYVDPFIYPDVDNEKLDSILKKHSNLLKTGQTYNRRAVNLIDVYQTIAKTILEKLEDLEKKQTVYERPMNPGYHLSGGNYDYTSEEFIE
jgi:gas vesicle protein